MPSGPRSRYYPTIAENDTEKGTTGNKNNQNNDNRRPAFRSGLAIVRWTGGQKAVFRVFLLRGYI
jgi:hypothetical protein